LSIILFYLGAKENGGLLSNDLSMEQEDYKFIRDISIHKRRTRNEKNGTLCMNEGLTVMMLFLLNGIIQIKKTAAYSLSHIHHYQEG
jgi:hypothetical protein